ncbi:MAG TPA: PhzF family phenazine biosynthesis protein [Longimicrobiales bacterium]|nr:PhzF family phenazine biosynthesis protein [Longimicrobiales bacterium]
MKQPIVQVDAFTDRAFAGNPAAVCILTDMPGDDWLRAVALEMNLSETAFLVRDGDAYRLRWFTPAVEVDLCGHATLASAHVLWEDGHLRPDETAEFDTRSGRLRAMRDHGWITLDFPAKHAVPAEPPAGLLEALGVDARAVLRNVFDYLVECESADQVRGLQPDFTQLQRVEMRGVMVTALSDDPRFDFVSRFFAPAAGVNEDPVTGSAHCALGPYWADRLGKNPLIGYQASARGGMVRVEVKGDRVLLGGKAVTVLRGELLAD